MLSFAVSTASAAEASTSPVEGAAMDAEAIERANADFEAMAKLDLKQMEDDLKETTKSVNAQFTGETELEDRLHEKKLAFRKTQRDARLAFEKAAIESWKALIKRLRDASPAERAAEKTEFDQKAMQERTKFNDESAAKSLKFLEEQNDERHAYWTAVQKAAAETRRVSRVHETKWGGTSTQR